ncbi:MAG: methyltransferase domain-containing protein [Mobilitalea sp.]
MSKRNELILQNINVNGIGLEIGPSFSPVCPKSNGYNIETIDHLDREGLINKYKDDPNVKDQVNKIEEVNYVWSGQPYSQLIGKTEYYDYIIASHVIEHCVDIIDFLSECSKILKKDGTISLAIPDKRYTFDYFREITSVRTVIDNHVYREHFNHSLGTFVDHNLNIVTLDFGGTYMPNSAHLLKEHMIYEHDIIKLRNAMENYSEKEYTDCHSWILTPASFKILIYQLNALNLIDLSIEDIYKETNSVEFIVKLKKGKVSFDSKELLELQLEKHLEFKESNSYDFIINELAKDKKIYIYGTGNLATNIIALVNKLNVPIEGFVLSDDQPLINKIFHNKPVYHLSELVPEKDNIGVVLSVAPRLYQTIEKNLKDKGFEHYI